MVVRGSFHASDPPLGTIAALSWTYLEAGVAKSSGTCPVPLGAAEADCAFVFKVGALPANEPVQLVASAVDGSLTGNRADETMGFMVYARPTFATMSPTTGGTSGGTDIVITGSGFLPGSQALINDVPLFPNGGVVTSDGRVISARVPAHTEGSVVIVVSTPIGDAIHDPTLVGSPTLVFDYQAPPSIETIVPATGSAAGGTAVEITGTNFSATTQIYFGSTLDGALPLESLFVQSDTTIVGLAPAGSGQTTVWAFDDALGFTRLTNGFTWRTP
jgi:hypothetical protein